MSNMNNSQRTIDGFNTLVVDIIDIDDAIVIQGDEGNANQVLGKNALNNLVYKEDTIITSAGVGLHYNLSTQKIDINLNDNGIYGTVETDIDGTDDFIIFLKDDNTTKKICPELSW